jgi:hypothetical protein
MARVRISMGYILAARLHQECLIVACLSAVGWWVLSWHHRHPFVLWPPSAISSTCTTAPPPLV